MWAADNFASLVVKTYLVGLNYLIVSLAGGVDPFHYMRCPPPSPPSSFQDF